MSEIALIKQQSEILMKSDFMPPHVKNLNQLMAIALKGRDLGLSVWQSVNYITVIQGKPTMSAEGMLAMIYKNCPSAEVKIEEGDAGCVINARRRPEHEFSRFEFSRKDAEHAQLLNKDSWKKYPKAMYKARCISSMARAMFPDCIMGVSYTPEELQSIDQPAPPPPPSPVKEVKEVKTVDIFEAEIAEEPAFDVSPAARAATFVCKFGKYSKGKTLREVGPKALIGLCKWVMDQPDGKQNKNFVELILNSQEYLRGVKDLSLDQQMSDWLNDSPAPGPTGDLDMPEWVTE